jgi:membrane-associated protease RseP (regulator of RpoE activity)
MDCVFGVALLRQFIVEFDYVMPRLTLRDRATYRPPAGTEAIPLLFRANPRVPYVDIRITLRDGSELPLRVLPDTGTSFYGAVLVGGARARVQSQLPYTPAISYPDPQQGRIVQISAGRPQSIAIGSFTMNQPVIAFVQGTLGNGIADGTIGCGFFKRFVVGFDFDGRVMYLRPNAPFSPRQEFDASGIGFIRRGGRHVVFKVIADSVAAAAEVHVGDVLSEIDGRPAAELTASQLRGLLSVDGATRRLLLQREGRSVEIRLRLKTRI